MEAPIWSSVPWKRSLNITENTLLNILIRILGLLEDIAEHGDYARFKPEISEYISELYKWRTEWYHAHPTAVWETFDHSTDETTSALSLDETLSKPLEFSSVSLALEIIYYNSALIQLMRLKWSIVSPFIRPTPVRRENMAYICRMAHGANGNGLLLPHQIRFQCQLAIEALRITQYITRELQRSVIDQYIPPSPFGIIYWALVDEPEIQSYVASKLFECPPFTERKVAFEEFKAHFQLPQKIII